jgi:hypothetical protein
LKKQREIIESFEKDIKNRVQGLKNSGNPFARFNVQKSQDSGDEF